MELPARRRNALAGRDCIIVDDVLTTGATIGEVHRVLVLHGARVLGAVVVAATSSPIGTATQGAQVPPAPPPMVS
jgi:predicted amidophosphoribosyltransferase